MIYRDFIEQLTGEVENIINKKEHGSKVVVRTVTKNNGVAKKALSIIKPSIQATPTIYLDKFYNEFKDGKSIAAISEEIFQIYQSGMAQFEADIDIDRILDFSKVKSRVFFKVINYELNKPLLADLPHKRVLDLAIVFYIEVSASGDGNATALIHNYHVGHWGVTEEKLKELAFENTVKIRKANILRIEDIIKDIILDEIMVSPDGSDTVICEDGEYDGKPIKDIEAMVEEELENYKGDYCKDMFVLTNDIRFNGAACMFYPDVIKNFAGEIDSDLYIIPSSIHEVILVPKYHDGVDRLTEILNEVNEKEVDPMEVLGSRVYEYNRNEDEIKYGFSVKVSDVKED